ncbi:hypothetical protein [Burkholderia cepacia]|uniref:hypothetical protein n=1 Tax=Burkholderia cepacia TaxID=292 RepID=UPI000751AC4D|nr:hypothetical protein [Burkholderia cepacia]KVX54936.1 hypothetical protein WL06_12375 [Burkholderia cepacia]KWD59217.1 hypothetical protein WL68_24460 [Burkholderia cepacia]KWD85149.1 hypothetical protein WL69_10755 [Burkholderia cepacia]
MAMIVAGRFTTFDEAESGARSLYERAFGTDDVSIFFLNPGGQHARFPIGGDVYADTAAKPGGRGATVGAMRGLLIGAVVGVAVYAVGVRYWFVPAAGALAGAYLGALGGALGRMRGEQDEGKGTLARSETGVILAAHVTPETAATAEDVLRATGAKSIERVDGDWQDGKWRDFDPVRRPDEAARRRGR